MNFGGSLLFPYAGGGYISNEVCPSVCLFVSEQRNSKSYEWIFFKFSASVHIYALVRSD